MDQRRLPSPRIKPLPPEHTPELKEQFESMPRNLGFIPNNILIMQRKPKLARALAQLTAAIWDISPHMAGPWASTTLKRTEQWRSKGN